MTDTRKREIPQGGGGSGTGESSYNNSSVNAASGSTDATDAAAAAAASATTNKRNKKAWLNFTGKRHTRVGLDYQVAVLPSCRRADPNEARVVSSENSPVASS
jgi:hypothetical protein